MNICTYNKKCKERRQQEMGIIIGAFLGKQHDISLNKQEKAIWIMVAGYSALIISGSTSNF